MQRPSQNKSRKISVAVKENLCATGLTRCLDWVAVNGSGRFAIARFILVRAGRGNFRMSYIPCVKVWWSSGCLRTHTVPKKQNCQRVDVWLHILHFLGYATAHFHFSSELFHVVSPRLVKKKSSAKPSNSDFTLQPPLLFL